MGELTVTRASARKNSVRHIRPNRGIGIWSVISCIVAVLQLCGCNERPNVSANAATASANVANVENARAATASANSTNVGNARVATAAAKPLPDVIMRAKVTFPDDAAYAKARAQFEQWKFNHSQGYGTDSVMWELKKAAWKGFSDSKSDGLDPYAHEYLGRAFLLDRDSDQGQKEIQVARELYLERANQGNAVAQTRLGTLYGPEVGQSEDRAQYLRWLQKAADQDYAEAETTIGQAFSDGYGVAKDPQQAFKWFEKAATQGDARAQSKLGVAYANGQGTAKDEARALLWIRKAAEQGYPNAQRNLGIIYRNGSMGVAKDENQGVLWLQRAADQGDSDASRILAASQPQPAKSASSSANQCTAFRDADQNTVCEVAKSLAMQGGACAALASDLQNLLQVASSVGVQKEIFEQTVVGAFHQSQRLGCSWPGMNGT